MANNAIEPIPGSPIHGDVTGNTSKTTATQPRNKVENYVKRSAVQIDHIQPQAESLEDSVEAVPLTALSSPSSDALKLIKVSPPVYVTPLEHLGEEPRDIDCPFCHYVVKTQVTHKSSSTTCIAALFIAY
ncbi:hypothetical protein MMC12_007095 [Toensbergia leucococca]|nr:hypothetical protein [Toensbergia leucococca]